MKIIFMLLVFIFQEFSWAQKIEIKAESLAAMVEERNLQVQALKLQKEAAHDRTSYLLKSFVPNLSVYGIQESYKSGKADIVNQPEYGAEMNINIFNGSRDWFESDIRNLNRSKKMYEFDRVLSEEIFNVKSHYWSIIFLQKKKILLREAIEINAKNYGSAKKRIQNGVATESDSLEFEMKTVELNRELEEVKLALDKEIGELRVLLNFDEKVELNFSLQELEHEHDFETEIKHSLKDHEFLYKEYDLQAEILHEASNKEANGWLPTLDVFASYNQYNQREKDFLDAGDRTESVMGLKMTMSLANVVEMYKETAALRKESLAMQKVAEQKRMEIENHIHNEVAELSMLHKLVHDAEENVKRAQKYYQITMSEYARGVKNSPDVLGASEKLFSAKESQFKIIRDFQISKAHILSKIKK